MGNENRDNDIKLAAIEKTLRDFSECINNLKRTFEDTRIPIDDDNTTFHRFCVKLEYLFQIGIRDQSTLFRSKKNPWYYFYYCLGKSKNIHDGIRFVKANHELKTSEGKLRSFIRFCLIHQCFADTVQQCIVLQDITMDFYDTNSLFGNPNMCSKFIAILYELNDIQFDLSPTGYDLDVGWPTFARKQFISYSCKSPSLTTSFLSSGSQSIASFSTSFTSPLLRRRSSMAGSQSENSLQQADQQENGSSLDQRLLNTIGQLTDEKESLEKQVALLTQQLEEERKNVAESNAVLESEREKHVATIMEWKERVTNLENLVQKRKEEADIQIEDVKTLTLEKEQHLEAAREEIKTLKFQLASQQLEHERNIQAFNKQQTDLKTTLEKLKENQQLVSELQQKLQILSGEKLGEKESLDAQVRQLKLGLMARNEECEGLINELRTTVAEMDELRTSHMKLESELSDSKSNVDRLKAEVDLLRDESLHLRNKVVRLIKEKDSLWKRSDRLLYLQRVQASDKWIPDNIVRHCQSCHTTFTLFNRRHHCRLCGRIFCHSCSNNWLNIAASCRRVRTCDECFIIHCEFSHPDADKLLQVDSNDILDESLSNGTHSQESEGSLGLAMDTTPCAGFSVISDEEIVQSLHESSPYVKGSPSGLPPVEIRTSSLRSLDMLMDIESNQIATEAFISAAMIYRIPLNITQTGCVLSWRFRTEPKSIAFSLIYFGENFDENFDDKATVQDFQEIIVETTLHKPSETFVEGSTEIWKPGVYCVYFDNSFSRFLAKKVTFYLKITELPCNQSSTEG